MTRLFGGGGSGGSVPFSGASGSVPEAVPVPAGQTISFWPVGLDYDTSGYFTDTAGREIVLPSNGYYRLDVNIVVVETTGLNVFGFFNSGTGALKPAFFSGGLVSGAYAQGAILDFSQDCKFSADARPYCGIENDGLADIHVVGVFTVSQLGVY